MRSNTLLNIEDSDTYCFQWSILDYLLPSENSHPSRVRIYIPFFNEINFGSFDLTNGFKCNDVQKFEKLNDLSINVFELDFYQLKTKWKLILIPIEVGKYDESDRVVD